jgi:hypothetical protein
MPFTQWVDKHLTWATITRNLFYSVMFILTRNHTYIHWEIRNDTQV